PFSSALSSEYCHPAANIQCADADERKNRATLGSSISARKKVWQIHLRADLKNSHSKRSRGIPWRNQKLIPRDPSTSLRMTTACCQKFVIAFAPRHCYESACCA